MTYRQERREFIARMAKEGLPEHLALMLLREATGLNRRAELACSSEAADRDRVRCPAWHPIPGKSSNAVCLCDWPGWTAHGPQVSHTTIPRITLEDWRAEQRIKTALAAFNVSSGLYTGNETQKGLWSFLTSGDPRGYTLRVIPPSYAERNAGRDIHNLDSIGVPCGPSGLRF